MHRFLSHVLSLQACLLSHNHTHTQTDTHLSLSSPFRANANSCMLLSRISPNAWAITFVELWPFNLTDVDLFLNLPGFGVIKKNQYPDVEFITSLRSVTPIFLVVLLLFVY